MNGLTLAILAALFLAILQVIERYATKYVNSTLAAIIVSVAAVTFGSLVLLLQKRPEKLITDNKGIILLVFAGICAFLIDFLTLKAYGSNIPISVAGPIIIGGSTAILAFIGFFLGDGVSFLKILGILLIMTGGAILAAFQK